MLSCEACHGPGNLHVQLANAKSLFLGPQMRLWTRHAERPVERARDSGVAPRRVIPGGASCRRTITRATTTTDGFHNELLGELTYHADGQILDEVYEYGCSCRARCTTRGLSARTVTIPIRCGCVTRTTSSARPAQAAHPAEVRWTGAPPPPTPRHGGMQCVNCHMPVTKYMAVRSCAVTIACACRLGLSVDLGVPNACTGCHLEAERARPRTPEPKRASLTQYAAWMRALADDVDVC